MSVSQIFLAVGAGLLIILIVAMGILMVVIDKIEGGDKWQEPEP